MGVDRNTLPKWEDIPFLPAQLASRPLTDEVPVNTKVTIGKNAKNPLILDIPLFVSDMSFGALLREAKIALSNCAEMAGTGICSGEGGMLPEEQENNSRYFCELASGKFGFSWDKVKKAQAFHFKGGQGAKTGTGGHLPGNKVTREIAEVRGLKEGEPAISPAAFPDLCTPKDFADFANEVRKQTGGIPVGFKIAASHIEQDINFALEAGIDYIILDGRGGGTGAAPKILRDNINVPTIPALARARKHLDKVGESDITLIVTGGLRTAEDFAKALMLGAEAVAISNSALQAIGCLGMRACHTNNCPVGVATQKENLRQRIIIENSAKQLSSFLISVTELMKVVCRAFQTVAEFNHRVQNNSKHAELMTLALKHAILKRDVSHLTFPDEMQEMPAGAEKAQTPEGRISSLKITPPEESIKKAISLIENAKRPVIIVGHGTRFDMEAIVSLAEILNSPVLTTFKGKGLIPDKHQLAAGELGRSGTPVASWMMNESDLLIVLGASFSNHTGITPKKPTIQVDFDPMALSKFHKIDAPIWGEISVPVSLMKERLESNLNKVDQRPELAKHWKIWHEEKQKRLLEDCGKGISSIAVFDKLSQHVPDNAIMCVDVGNNAYSLGRYFECKQQRFLMWRYLGSIGFAFPVAMGAWAATKGSRPIIAVAGDGGFAQYMAELTTSVKYGMDIKLILLNNNELGKISKDNIRTSLMCLQLAFTIPVFMNSRTVAGLWKFV